MESPRDYGLPHDQWRQYQYGTLAWLKLQRGIVLLQAPTGSGKTAIAKALGRDRSLTTLVRTKNLQLENYGRTYEFDVLFGRSNYDCIHPDTQGGNASDCMYNDDGMHSCPHSEDCPYLLQKMRVKGSSLRSLNYAYWLMAQWPRQEVSQILVMDEADELPEIVSDWASCTITEKDRLDWDLPPFPVIMGFDPLAVKDPIFVAHDWLSTARKKLLAHWESVRFANTIQQKRKKARIEELGMKIKGTMDAIMESQEDWFIKSGPQSRTVKGYVQPGFVVRPLTARHHWPSYFDVAETSLLMSATIGDNPVPFAEELGIESYVFKTIPHQYPPEDRPIIAPKDLPRLGQKAEESAYEKQADLVTQTIKDLDPSWSGILLVTSKQEAQNVARRLHQRGLEDRIWVVPETEGGVSIGTDRQTELWNERRQRVKGSLMISWSHWRGYDGIDEKILIALKTPFPRLGPPDSFEYMRMKRNGALYHWRTGNILAQGLGRTRRTRDDFGQGKGLVMIADGNWTRIRNYLPSFITDSIVSDAIH